MSGLSDKEKEMITKTMGEAFGNEFGKIIDTMKKTSEEKKRLDDQRWTELITRLTRIELKFDMRVQLKTLEEQRHTTDSMITPGDPPQ